MRRPLGIVLSFIIATACLQTFFISVSLVMLSKEEDKSSRNLHVFVGRFPSPLENNSLHQTTLISKWSSPNNFEILPKRLISVFGLESSGTNLVADALIEAVGAKYPVTFQGLIARTPKQSRQRIEVQHISQPWGFFHHEGLENQTVVDIDVLPPHECMVWPHYELRDIQVSCNKAKPHPRCLNETGLRKRIILPQRFMVNITSHIQWYQERGTTATAVVVVRDDYAHLHGKLHIHNDNMTHALMEDSHAKEFIIEAIDRLSSVPENRRPPQLILVSYETLMALGEPYLFNLYKQLEINSTYTPKLKSGNKKYIQTPNGTDNETWWSADIGNRQYGR